MRHLISLIITFLLLACSREPAVKTFSIADMDTTACPADDFFRFANGGWIKMNPIPADQGSYDICDALAKKTEQQMLGILDSLASSNNKKGTIEDKIAKFYKSGMDTAMRNSIGLKPLQFLLDSIDVIKSIDDIQDILVKFGLYNINTPLIPRCFPDPKNCKMCVFIIEQGGLGIDACYFKDPDSEEIMTEYRKHLRRIFEISGLDSDAASQMAEKTFGVERKISDISINELTILNPNSTYNKITFDELKAFMPTFNWDKFIAGLGCSTPHNIIVTSGSDYLINFDKLLREIPINDWKAYLKARVINNMASTLSADFVNEDFEFYERYMMGVEECSPLPTLVLNQLNNSYGDALGREYVKKYFSPKTKKSVEELCDKLRNALCEHISQVNWMSDETKKYAIEKTGRIEFKIGYPNKFIDFAECLIDSCYAMNVLRVFKAQTIHELQFIDKPNDTDMWMFTPQTANMYYLRNLNFIEIPAAMLQPPFFFVNGDDATNYGALGAAIGHEITHGFDNAGRFYDKDGNLAEWWNSQDSIEFERRAKKLIDRFNSFIVIDSLHTNGELTLDENIADLGGIRIAYTAFSKTSQWQNQSELIDGFTPDQRFFIAYAHTWAGAYRDEMMRLYTLTNEHAIGKYRVEGPLPNLNAFIDAFGVKPGDRYYIADSLRTEIW